MTNHPIGAFLAHVLDQGSEEWDQWVGYMITHKGYIGHFAFDEGAGLFRGTVVNIKDVVTFEGTSIEKTRQAFQDAVDEYLDWCAKYGRAPTKFTPPLP